MSLSEWDTYVGVNGRLSDFSNGHFPGSVRVTYKDTEGIQRVVNICPSGARRLALALRKSADVLDPPKPRKRANRGAE